jgi:hypothetical protein
MAIVLYSGGVSEFRGSIGGTTFQNTRAGHIVRSKPGRSKPMSEKQNAIIIQNSFFLKYWFSLTSLQRDEWQEYADDYPLTDKWGQTKYLNGCNYFIYVNNNRHLISQAIKYSPSFPTEPAAIGSFDLLLYLDSFIISFDIAQLDNDSGCVIYTTPPIRRYTDSIRSEIRLTKVIDTVDFTNIDISSDWKSTHNLPLPVCDVNDRYYVGIHIQYIHKTSGMSGVFSKKVSYYEALECGIGNWIIETNFIIS